MVPRLPAPRGTDAAATDFSGARAMERLSQLAVEPRPAGSPAAARARDRLAAWLEQMGVPARRQQRTADGIEIENLVATLRGTSSTGAVLLCAHVDTVPRTPGASDDGAGVVVLLEVMRALASGPRLRNDLVLLLTDAEEQGRLGARHFIDQHPVMPDVRAVINLEAVGNGGPLSLFEVKARSTVSSLGWFAGAWLCLAALLFAAGLGARAILATQFPAPFTGGRLETICIVSGVLLLAAAPVSRSGHHADRLARGGLVFFALLTLGTLVLRRELAYMPALSLMLLLLAGRDVSSPAHCALLAVPFLAFLAPILHALTGLAAILPAVSLLLAAVLVPLGVLATAPAWRVEGPDGRAISLGAALLGTALLLAGARLPW